MKQISMSLAAVLLMAFFSVPALAQEEKEKNKEEKIKKEKESEQIIITRKNADQKVVIEIDGDKIKVNGKPIEDLKDGEVSVHRNRFNMGGLNAFAFPRNSQNDFDFHGGMLDNSQNRALLGVVTEEVDGGVEINEVTKESAASKAGLKAGDVITKIDDKKISDPDQLTEVIRSHKPGDKVGITYLRDKKEQKVTTELGKWKGTYYTPGTPGTFSIPDAKELEGFRSTPPFSQNWSWAGNSPRLGLSVQDTDDGKGVKVVEVDEDTNAAKAGLKENDIITHVNDKEVNSADEVAKIVKENKDKISIQVKLKRDGKPMNFEVKMPRKIKTVDM